MLIVARLSVSCLHVINFFITMISFLPSINFIKTASCDHHQLYQPIYYFYYHQPIITVSSNQLLQYE